MTLPLPDLQPMGELRVPEWAERSLSSDLTVIVIRRPSVPLVELRLWVPFAQAPLAPADMLGATLLAGTESMSNVQIAAELQALGGALAVSVDPDRMLVSGNALVTGLDRTLEILADVITGACYPSEEVATERSRLADRIHMARSQPSHLARTALLRRVFAGHPYAVQTPEPDDVRGVAEGTLRELHQRRVRPAGAVLVLVGDVDPEAALDSASKALAGWEGDEVSVELPPIPPLSPGPLVLSDRPGSVQSSLRVALPAVDRTHPDHASLQLANLIFGGYFSSRWVENIREDKGYTYGANSSVEHSLAGSVLVASAEVATEVTAPALVETLYELGRMATLQVRQEELNQARQYLLGNLQLGISTQAGLAGLVAIYAGFGLRPDRLARYAADLAATTVDDVAAAAARYLAPAQAVPVVLGDAERLESSLAALTPVSRESL